MSMGRMDDAGEDSPRPAQCKRRGGLGGLGGLMGMGGC